MVTVTREGEGLRVAADRYRLWFRPDRPYAALEDAHGARWADLATIASVHTTTALDDTAALGGPGVGEEGGRVVVELEARSSAWARRTMAFECHDDYLAVRVSVEGSGRLADVHLLGGFVSATPRWPSGFQASWAGFRSVVVPDPSTPERDVSPASEPGAVDVLGGGLPGKGRWFFTPGPLCVAISRGAPSGALDGEPWASLGVTAPVDELTFSGMHYEPGERSFSIRLAYEGETAVSGRWQAPALVLTFDAPDAYAAIADHAALVRRLGHGREPGRQARRWWREPMFCGWGAQCHLAETAGPPARPADFARQDAYDRFLAELAAAGVEPGTVVIDDRWERAYGTGEADPDRWPDLPAWIAARHAEGRRVLLWWKAWAPDGVDPALCVRNAAGRAVAVDPSNPAYGRFLAERLARMLGPDGYDADGLKVDFTAWTPSGPGMHRAGPEWGIALLHRLLETIHRGAVDAKPDALVITHSPHPGFGDVTDMLRLNDVQRLDDPSPGAPFVEHMVHRARIVQAAMPGLLIDTDNWALPDRRTWRAYLERQPDLGVPALYYTTHLDRSGEALTTDDHAALRATWAAYRARLGPSSGTG